MFCFLTIINSSDKYLNKNKKSFFFDKHALMNIFIFNAHLIINKYLEYLNNKIWTRVVLTSSNVIK